MFCSQCGVAIAPDARFCSACGAAAASTLGGVATARDQTTSPAYKGATIPLGGTPDAVTAIKGRTVALVAAALVLVPIVIWYLASH